MMNKIFIILTFILFVFPAILFSQDLNGDGLFDNNSGIKNNTISQDKITSGLLLFSQYWTSTTGMFSNVNDVQAGYFDNDTLLDIACYTFSPSVFYIYEQVPTKPDSFAVVFQYNKVENGSFGPMTFGDSDGDGLVEIIAADYSTLSRIYIFENTGNNAYISRETQNTLTMPTTGEQSTFLHITDMNKNGKKEIVLGRSTSSTPISCNIRFWEQTGSIGSHTYTNLYTYNGSMYLFGRSGVGDSDGDGWDELFITYGGFGNTIINVSRIVFDSVSTSFQFRTTPITKTGLPCSYNVADVNNDGIKELIMTASNFRGAAMFVLKSIGANSYTVLDSMIETADNNSMICAEVKKLSGETYPSILCGSFNGKVYIYNYNGTTFEKQYEKTDFPTGAIRRVIWTDIDRKNGFTLQNGNIVRLFKRDTQLGIVPISKIPGEYKLYQNYPNPFNPVTKIKFQVPNMENGKTENSIITLKVFDLLGREVATLVNEKLQPGIYEVPFSNSQFSDKQITSGVYFYKLITDDFIVSKKMMLIK